jgi:hypothetical protein
MSKWLTVLATGRSFPVGLGFVPRVDSVSKSCKNIIGNALIREYKIKQKEGVRNWWKKTLTWDLQKLTI